MEMCQACQGFRVVARTEACQAFLACLLVKMVVACQTFLAFQLAELMEMCQACQGFRVVARTEACQAFLACLLVKMAVSCQTLLAFRLFRHGVKRGQSRFMCFSMRDICRQIFPAYDPPEFSLKGFLGGLNLNKRSTCIKAEFERSCTAFSLAV